MAEGGKEFSFTRRGRFSRGMPRTISTRAHPINDGIEPIRDETGHGKEGGSLAHDFGLSHINLSVENEVDKSTGPTRKATFEEEVREILHELRNRHHDIKCQGNRHEVRINTLEVNCVKTDRLVQEVDTRLTRGLNSNNNRLDEVNARLGAAQERRQRSEEHNARLTGQVCENASRIDKVQEEHERLVQNINERREDGIGDAGQERAPSCHMANMAMKLDLPTFSAAIYERPMQFLRSFLNYTTAMRISEQYFKYIVTQALKGPAKDWWEHIEDQVTSIRDFRARFCARYWGSTAQAAVKRELEFGFYTAEANLSRSEYVLRLYNKVVQLDDTPNLREVIEKFSRHFDEQIQQSILSRGITTIDELLTLLDTLDNAGILNSTIADRNRTYRPETSWRQRSTYESGGYRRAGPPPRENNFQTSTPIRQQPSRSRNEVYGPDRPTNALPTPRDRPYREQEGRGAAFMLKEKTPPSRIVGHNQVNHIETKEQGNE